jgi:hypothetical protein
MPSQDALAAVRVENRNVFLTTTLISVLINFIYLVRP